MKKIILNFLFIIFTTSLISQNVGDTIRVKAFDFTSESRDSLVMFPDNPALSYEKILLKYSLRCHDGLVNNGQAPSEGCRDFDLSCNTYIVDSTKIEAESNIIASHEITNFEESTFPFRSTPVFDFLRGTQTNTEIVNTLSENTIAIGSGSNSNDQIIKTNNIANKAQYLYTSEELISNGLVAGEIDALSLTFLQEAGIADFFEINIKHTQKTELDGQVDLDGFTRVFRQNSDFIANSENRFN